jgi:CheY-like chemotaxis protein
MKPKLLLIDEDGVQMPMVVQDLAPVLDVIQTRSVDELKRVLKSPPPFKAILLDLMMPSLHGVSKSDTDGGYRAGAYIYEHFVAPVLSDVPVVILTAVDTRTTLYGLAERQVARVGQFRGTLEKPVDGDDVLEFLVEKGVLDKSKI